MMLFIAFGYIIFIIYAALCIVGISLVCCIIFRVKKKGLSLFEKTIVEKVPYVRAVSSLKKKQFTSIE